MLIWTQYLDAFWLYVVVVVVIVVAVVVFDDEDVAVLSQKPSIKVW